MRQLSLTHLSSGIISLCGGSHVVAFVITAIRDGDGDSNTMYCSGLMWMNLGPELFWLGFVWGDSSEIDYM